MINLVTTRHDGFTAKINTILTGCMLSGYYSGKFKFVWINDNEVKNDSSFHSVPDDIYELFSKEFILNHYLDVSEMDELLYPQSKFSLETFTINNDHSQEFLQAPFGFGNFGKKLGYNNIFNYFSTSMFKSSISDKLLEVKNISLPNNAIGIHYRAGDIIYGNLRKKGRYARGKSISLVVCEEVIKSLVRNGKKPILFSSNLNDIRMLKEKFPELFSIEDFDLDVETAHEQVLCECVLMSKCAEVITAGDSAVTILAQNISGVNLIKFDDFISPDDELNLYRNLLENQKNYDKLQYAFCFYNAYLLSDKFDEKIKFLEKASSFDIDNDLYLVTKILMTDKYLSNLKNKFIKVYKNNFEDIVDLILKGKNNNDLYENSKRD